MSNVAEFFAGMDTAKSMGGGQYFRGEGKFVVVAKKMFVNDGHKGRFFIVEFEVLSSTSPSDPVGATRSWAVPLTGERAQYSFSDIKALVFALNGEESPGQPAEKPALHREATQYVMAACDALYAKTNNIDATLLLDVPVQLETNQKTTKRGGTFTVHRWSPAPLEAA